VPTKPTTLPIWATNAGSNVVTGLAIDNINWQTGTTSTVRYTFTGSPDLSAVIVGHQLVASGCTDGTHNGTFEIAAVNNASDWIEVVNAAVTDATLDEASSPGTAIAKTGTSLIQVPTSSKQTMGWLNSERPPAGYFNWLTNLAYDWLNWLDGWSTDTDAAIAELTTNTTVVTANTTAAVSNHYFVNSSARKKITLPSTFAVGDEIRITGMGAGGWMIKPATGDTINASGGSVPSSGTAIFNDQQYTSISLEANSANNSWIVTGYSGTFTIRDPALIVTTFAGSSSGYSDGTGTAAQFNAATGVTVDTAGNVYVADQNNHRIRKITNAGVVTTFAGSGTPGTGDGTGTAAQFNAPLTVSIDDSDNLYVCDSGSHRIRKITPGGVVTTFAGSSSGSADGTGTAALFNTPHNTIVDSAGNLFVADIGNNRIRKITPGGVVTTFAGSSSGSADGTGTAALFSSPSGITIDGSDNLYVADNGNNRIRKITSAGVVTTFAGSSSGSADGTGTAALFSNPWGVSIDSAGSLYVSDSGNLRIRKITSAGAVTTIAGSTTGSNDGSGTAAKFAATTGIIADTTGNLFVADNSNHRIRKIENEDA
jgi:sugar lactone lactonase YvrE